jgi:hypothetical protein
MNMATKNSERGELIATAEFGQFAGIEDEEMETEMKIAVNKPLTGIPTKHSERVFGERIEVYKKKLGGHMNPQGEMVAVKKKWRMFQKPLGAQESEIVGQPTRVKPTAYYPDESENKPTGELTPLQAVKNQLDNLASDVRSINSWVKVALIFGTIGVLGCIGWFISLAK